MIGNVCVVEDVVIVFGNFIDNVVMVVVFGLWDLWWVEVFVFSDGDVFVCIVVDLGLGFGVFDVLMVCYVDDVDDCLYGYGIGLLLCIEIVCWSGGDFWVIDLGGDEYGVVFVVCFGGVVDVVLYE